MQEKRMNKSRYSKFEERSRINHILELLRNKEQNIFEFNEIHEIFVNKGIVSNSKYKANTRRILRRLINKGYLAQVDRGKYKLKMLPDSFDIVKLINNLKNTYGNDNVYEWRSGGALWTLAEGIIFGMPSSINPIYKQILEILLIRLASIFDAIVELSITSRMSNEIISDKVLREFVINVLPHIIGERCGVDNDGLPLEHIIKLYEELLEHMPEAIEEQPIHVTQIKEYIEESKIMLDTSRKNCNNIKALNNINEMEKVVLVVYPPKRLIDENENERKLYELLKTSIKEGESDASLLAFMRVYDEEIVEKVINYLPSLNEERKENVLQLYKLARAGMILDNIITDYLKYKYGSPFLYEDVLKNTMNNNNSNIVEEADKDILNAIRKELNYMRRKYGYSLEDMIKGIWLSNWSFNIKPDFVIFNKNEDDVEFIKTVIKEALEAMDITSIRNLDTLIKEGYKLVNNLDELLKKDAEKN